MSLSDDQKKVAAAHPDAQWLADHRLCVFRPEGVLNGKLVAKLLAWLEEIETDVPQPFRRYTDLTKLQTVKLDEFEVANIATWRRTVYMGYPVKSAFMVGSSETREVADAYKGLMEGSRITVEVFDKLEEAARWLHVPEEALA